MEYQKTVYFTITAPSLNTDNSIISVVDEYGNAVNWCHFSHFEQLEEEKWRLVFTITSPYYYFIGQETVRYCYVVGILYGEEGSLCKKINISDNVRIKQDGCLSEIIGLSSDNIVTISQDCDFIIFLNEDDTIYSPCSDEGVDFMSSVCVGITQECEDVTILVTYETILEDECADIKIISSDSSVINQYCEEIELISSSDSSIVDDCTIMSFDGPFTNQVDQYCGVVSDVPSDTTLIEQECQGAWWISNSELFISQKCPELIMMSNTAVSISENCDGIEFKSSESATIGQECPVVIMVSNTAASLSDNCDGVEFKSSESVTIRQECSNISLISSDNTAISQGCVQIYLLSNEYTEVEQDCGQVHFLSKKVFSVNQDCSEAIEAKSSGIFTISQVCGYVSPIFAGIVHVIQGSANISPISSRKVNIGPTCEEIYDMVYGNIDLNSNE